MDTARPLQATITKGADIPEEQEETAEFELEKQNKKKKAKKHIELLRD